MNKSGLKKCRLGWQDVRVGVALPWDTYDVAGRLLLRKGAVITTTHQLYTLLAKGLYRIDSAEKLRTTEPINIKPPVFNVIDHFIERLGPILRAMIDGQATEIEAEVLGLCAEIQELCASHSDAALSAMHLDQEGAYTIVHSLYCAMLCDLLGQRAGSWAEERRIIMAAALTANLGMLDLQEILLKHPGPLSDEQWAEIRRHPQRSVELLRAAGVSNDDWLQIVVQHHEKADGSGYPGGLTSRQICFGAKLLGVTDRYHAMISDREYRAGLLPTEALRKIFIYRSKEADEEIVQLLIKEIGVYPPGAYVRLANGEIAVVTRRGRDGTAPVVSSIISPRGAPYSEPHERNCSLQDFNIKEMTLPEKSLPKSKIYDLWAYDKKD